MVCMNFADSKTVLAILGSCLMEAVYLFRLTRSIFLNALETPFKDRRIACVRKWCKVCLCSFFLLSSLQELVCFNNFLSFVAGVYVVPGPANLVDEITGSLKLL